MLLSQKNLLSIHHYWRMLSLLWWPTEKHSLSFKPVTLNFQLLVWRSLKVLGTISKVPTKPDSLKITFFKKHISFVINCICKAFRRFYFSMGQNLKLHKLKEVGKHWIKAQTWPQNFEHHSNHNGFLGHHILLPSDLLKSVKCHYQLSCLVQCQAS